MREHGASEHNRNDGTVSYTPTSHGLGDVENSVGASRPPGKGTLVQGAVAASVTRGSPV